MGVAIIYVPNAEPEKQAAIFDGARRLRATTTRQEVDRHDFIGLMIRVVHSGMTGERIVGSLSAANYLELPPE